MRASRRSDGADLIVTDAAEPEVMQRHGRHPEPVDGRHGKAVGVAAIAAPTASPCTSMVHVSSTAALLLRCRGSLPGPRRDGHAPAREPAQGHRTQAPGGASATQGGASGPSPRIPDRLVAAAARGGRRSVHGDRFPRRLLGHDGRPRGQRPIAGRVNARHRAMARRRGTRQHRGRRPRRLEDQNRGGRATIELQRADRRQVTGTRHRRRLSGRRTTVARGLLDACRGGA